METLVTQICSMVVSVFLSRAVADSWSVNVPTQICAMKGSSVVLPCSYDFPQSRAGPEIRVQSEMWCLGDGRCVAPRYVYHSAGILLEPSYLSRVEYLGQIGSKNCSLKISGLREADSGTYVFYLITNHTTEKMPAQRGLQLHVSGSPSDVSVSALPSPVIVEGESVLLSCCSPGPSTEIVWFRSSSAEPGHRGAELTVGEATREDSGGYYCQVQTKDQAYKSIELLLDVQYPPRNMAVSVFPPEETEAGRPVTLTCSSEANPPVLMYSWYTGAACSSGADASSDEALKSLATETRGDLTLSSINVSSALSDVHCCVSRNHLGSQKSSVHLGQSSDSSRMIYVGVTIAALLVIIAIIAFVLKRKKKSSRTQSYALAPAVAPEP